MTHPRDDLDALGGAMDAVRALADQYLKDLPEARVRPLSAEDVDLSGKGLPEVGDGALVALRELIEATEPVAIRSAGPRFFHFVVGGVTPASLGADWMTSVLDQNVGMWAASPLGAHLESTAIGWLLDLFELPESWGGVLTTGATMANFVGLACARRWWGLQHGVDVDDEGVESLDPMPVFSSGYIHAASVKSLGMLGIGRRRVGILARDSSGRLDLDALTKGLEELDGAPSVIVANASEVNTGGFDPISDLVSLAEEHNTWVHVDGAFGLFSRLVPHTKSLTSGIERAHSVTADGHKWLNIPHDCGFSFVRDPSLLGGVFGAGAPYYVGGGELKPNYALLGPESSRRARAFTVWATLRAYGRSGYRAMVEHHLELAQHLARRVREEPELELLAEPVLNIVCFRYRPEGVDEETLDELNRALGEAVLRDGRVYFGTTVFEGKVAFRPAIVNYRTRGADVRMIVEVLKELAAGLTR